jgi:predicted RNase H-like HicB family nuclease
VYLTLEIEREADGRVIAEVPDLPGVLAYGSTKEEAIARAQALALRVLADRLENDEPALSLLPLDIAAADSAVGTRVTRAINESAAAELTRHAATKPRD